MKYTMMPCKRHIAHVFIACVAVLCLLACGGSSQRTELLTAEQFQSELEKQSEDHVQLIDVRTPEEYAGGHLAGAANVNLKNEQFKAHLANLDREKPVFVYCLSGGRSAKAAIALKDLGFTEVYDLKGGVMAWKQANLPVTTPTVAVNTHAITKADFEKVLAEHPVVLVDFYADWCLPCKQMEPTLLKLTEQYQDKVFIYRVNVEEAQSLTNDLKITGIPVFHLYQNGQLTQALQGYQEEKQLVALLEQKAAD